MFCPQLCSTSTQSTYSIQKDKSYPYTEHIFRKTNHIPGVKINGHNLNNLRYVDDTVLIAEDEASLQDLDTVVKDESEKCGLPMNIKKTKVMLLTKETKEKKVSIHVDHKEVKQVQSFTSLGQLITDDGKSEGQIRSRIGLAKMHSQRDINF